MLGSRSIGRLAAIFVTVLLIQITVVPHFRLNGYVIDLPLVVTLLICLYLSPANAAVMGFVSGLIFDLVLHTPFGMTAMTFSIGGYIAAGVSQQIATKSAATRAVAVAVLAATATSLFACTGALIGLEYVTRRELGAIAIVTAGAGMPAAMALHPLVRWAFPHEVVNFSE